MEEVVLVDQHNRVLGTHPKATVHTLETPLHRGFSVFIFNTANQLLLQQRSFSKLTWPGFWSNSCCGHPALGESVADAIHRRVRLELGMSVYNLQEVLPDFQYRCEYGGVVENEICPVWLARTHDEPQPDPAEVAATCWSDWDTFKQILGKDADGLYSPWCKLETTMLENAVAEFLLAGT
ncbi:MAG: isopentenyl-diphosphate Delta-isomerase [Gammaproteobacteria bacterium]|nr:isopentenyl-diphosphate Delta-isomerase [Gammaproteobacteria bacterium]MBU1725518.1 isopentenyl-diphosphate Delta-isomerase [Gammaproteobacteria bacterium]MBU2007376.1 isopentenyl-diphosphate Delta-isomerase [Gammaproteobacteria bacterium]